MHFKRMMGRFWWRTQFKATWAAAILLGLSRRIDSIAGTPLVTNCRHDHYAFCYDFSWFSSRMDNDVGVWVILDRVWVPNWTTIVVVYSSSSQDRQNLWIFWAHFDARRAVSLLLQLAWCGIPQILRIYPALRAPLLQLLMSRRSEWSYASSNCWYDRLVFCFFEICLVQNGQRFEQRPVHIRGGPSEFPTGFAAFSHVSGVSYTLNQILFADLVYILVY